MSISKLFTSIFAMFAIFGTDAFAAPSIRQIGVTTSSSKQSESNVERAATPSAKPAAKPATTASATTATSGDAARLVGVPFVSGKTSHNQKPNSKPSTASASTELISLREQLESLQNDFVALATQSYVDQQLANVRTEAAQAIVEAKNDMVTPEVLNQTVDNAVRDLASSETINEAMDAKIANLSTQVDTKLNKKIEQPQLNSAISDAVSNLASNDTIVSLTNRVDGHDTELSQTLKKNDTDSFRTELSKTELYSKVMDSNTGLTKVYEIANSAVKTDDLDTYVTTKNLASKNDITNTLGSLNFTVDQNAKQVKFTVGDDTTQHKFADVADLGGTPGCSSSVTTEPDSANRQMKVTTTNSCTNEIDTKYIPYGENAKEITIGVVDNTIKWKREGEDYHKIVDMADLKGQDAKEIQIGVQNNKITWNRVGETPQDIISIDDLKGQDAKEIQIGVQNNKITWNRIGETPQDIISIDDLKGQDAKEISIEVADGAIKWKREGESSHKIIDMADLKGQDGEGLTNEDKETIAEVRTIGTYFTNGKISQSHVDGLSEALANKLEANALDNVMKKTDSVTESQLPSNVMMKTDSVTESQLPNTVLKTGALDNVMMKGDAVSESQLPNNVMMKTDSVTESQLPNTVLKTGALDNVMMKGDSVSESQLPNTVLKTGDLDTVISDRGLLTSETLKTDSTFQNLINVLKAAEIIEDDPEGGYKPKQKNTQL